MPQPPARAAILARILLGEEVKARCPECGQVLVLRVREYDGFASYPWHAGSLNGPACKAYFGGIAWAKDVVR